MFRVRFKCKIEIEKSSKLIQKKPSKSAAIMDQKKSLVYVNKERIANGLFSTIYTSYSVGSPKKYALKVTEPDDEIKPHNSRNELKFLQEIKASGDASRSSLLEIVDTFEVYDELTMVFEFYPFTLETLILSKSRKRSNFDFSNGGKMVSEKRVNQFPVDEVKEIFKTLAKSLSFLHKNGIIHRDIKPSNIFFKDDTSEPILGDFGISWFPPNNYNKEEPDKKIIDVSTGLYKAPELCFGLTSYSEKIDIWSLGIMLTELYSVDCSPIIREEGNFSDLALIGSIFENFGTPTVETWLEIAQVESFQNLCFTEKERNSATEILPRCDDKVVLEVFEGMMVYESGDRLAADEILAKLHRLNR